MALSKPILYDVGNFDATYNVRLGFEMVGPDSFDSCTLTVSDPKTLAVIYSGTQTVEFMKMNGAQNGQYFFLLAGGSLQNNKKYLARISVYAESLDGADSRAISNGILFTCFAVNKFQIVNIPQNVVNSNIKVEFEYLQSAGYALTSLGFSLSNVNGVVKRKEDIYVASYNFSYTTVFEGLAPNTEYTLSAYGRPYGYLDDIAYTTTFTTSQFVIPDGQLSVDVVNCQYADLKYLPTSDGVLNGVEYVKFKCLLPDGKNWRTMAKISPRRIETGDYSVIDYMAPEKDVTYAVVLQYDGGLESGYLTNGVTNYNYRGRTIVGDKNGQFEVYYSKVYDTTNFNHSVGIYNPFNRVFPTFISNGKQKYRTGGFEAKIATENALKQVATFSGRSEGARSIVNLANAFAAFLMDKDNPVKTIKDSNGNYLMVRFVDAPSLSYSNEFGQQIITLSAQWVECGDVNDIDDWVKNGLAYEYGEYVEENVSYYNTYGSGLYYGEGGIYGGGIID